MPLTLSDEQAAALRAEREQWQRDRAVAEGATRIWNHEQLGNEAKALWKKAFPEAEIQGYDSEQRMLALLNKDREERAEEKLKAADKALNDDIAAKRQALKDKRGFTDDAVERLEKMMIERGIQNHEDAADLMASREPKPSEGDAGYDGHFWRHDQQPGYQDIVKDPEGYGRREILKTLRDMQARERR